MDLGFGPGRKSPTLARWLSIIPGLGHIYAGEYLAGIIWFIVSIPIMFMLGVFQVFSYGFGAIRLNLFFLFCYGFLVIWCAREASRTVAEQNARKAAQNQFSCKKKEKEEFERMKEEARKRLG
jgi:membrane protein implicated in regulation of membrane protease activity